MTVKELIDVLSRFDGDKPVHFETPDGDLIDDMVVQEGYEGIIIKEF